LNFYIEKKRQRISRLYFSVCAIYFLVYLSINTKNERIYLYRGSI